MKDPTPPDMPWTFKIVGSLCCVALSVGLVASWEWLDELREKASQGEECGT